MIFGKRATATVRDVPNIIQHTRQTLRMPLMGPVPAEVVAAAAAAVPLLVSPG